MSTGTIIRITIVFFIAMTILTGFIYPLVMTGVAQLIFPFQAGGSLVKEGEQIRGSRILAQEFVSERFFHGRPSAAGYGTISSGASNLTPVGKVLKATVETRSAEWKKQYGDAPLPDEMRYASASGLDPDIGIAAALIQVDRVAAARGLSGEQKSALIAYIKHNPGTREFFPSPGRVNIMDLNAKLASGRSFVVK